MEVEALPAAPLRSRDVLAPTTRSTSEGVTVVAYEPRHASAFTSLNTEWLERYFAVEQKDVDQFSDVQARIISRGGAILIALDSSTDVAIGCVALVPYREGELELAKMAVSGSAQGKGVGRKLMEAAIEKARGMGGVRSIYLESNAVLVPAVRLYESSGFRHLEPDERPTSPYARCDVYMRRML